MWTVIYFNTSKWFRTLIATDQRSARIEMCKSIIAGRHAYAVQIPRDYKGRWNIELVGLPDGPPTGKGKWATHGEIEGARRELAALEAAR